MIHLSNLSMSLAQFSERVRSAADLATAHASPLTTTAETDPENPPVIGPGPHHYPGLPTADSINNALKALRESLAGGIADRISAVALNPQPLPPVATPARIADRFSAVALNPQPLPPVAEPSGIANRLSAVALNPQPLPPKAMVEGLNRSSLAGMLG